MWLGAYSAISRPACAAASSATARAWPSLERGGRILGDEGLFDRDRRRLLFARSLLASAGAAPAAAGRARLRRGWRSRHARHGSVSSPTRRSRPSPSGQGPDRGQECESARSSAFCTLSVRHFRQPFASQRVADPSTSGGRGLGPDLHGQLVEASAGKPRPGRTTRTASPSRVGQLVIAIDVLHVVMVVEHFDQLDQAFAGVVVHRRRCSAAARRCRPMPARRAWLPAHRARR